MIPKVTAALDAGTPPDIAYADAFNLQTAGRWAFEGKLDDVSDIMAPIKDRFAPNTAEAAFLANGLLSLFWLGWAGLGARAYFRFTDSVRGWTYEELLVVMGLVIAGLLLALYMPLFNISAF